jgi:hypothetical protein
MVIPKLNDKGRMANIPLSPEAKSRSSGAVTSSRYAKQTSSEVGVKKQTADPCARRRFNNPVSKPKSIFMKPYAHSS